MFKVKEKSEFDNIIDVKEVVNSRSHTTLPTIKYSGPGTSILGSNPEEYNQHKQSKELDFKIKERTNNSQKNSKIYSEHEYCLDGMICHAGFKSIGDNEDRYKCKNLGDDCGDGIFVLEM